MALPSAGFRYRGSMVGNSAAPVVDKVAIIDDSATITLGDAVQIDTDGLCKLAGAGEEVAGIVIGIVDNKGIPVFSSKADHDGTVTGDHTYTASADNSSDKYIKAQICGDKNALWYNNADDDMAQTNEYQFYNVVAASDQIDESEASDTAGQFQLIKRDPDGDGDASKGLFIIAESQKDAYVQQ